MNLFWKFLGGLALTGGIIFLAGLTSAPLADTTNDYLIPWILFGYFAFWFFLMIKIFTWKFLNFLAIIILIIFILRIILDYNYFNDYLLAGILFCIFWIFLMKKYLNN